MARFVMQVALFVVCLGACGGRSDERAPTGRERTARSSAPEADAPTMPAGDRPERLGGAPASPIEDPEDARDEAAMNRVLSAAATAAENAPRGRDTCETAFLGMHAMIAQVARETRERVPEPDREAFLEACQAMSPAVQECLVPTHAFTHQESCERILAEAPEDARQRLEAAVSGGAE